MIVKPISQPLQTDNYDDLILDEEVDHIVPQAKLKRLVHIKNDELRQNLKHSKLRAIIRSVDGAGRNRKKKLKTIL